MSYQLQVGDTEIAVTSVTNAVAIYNITVDVIRLTKVSGSRGTSETPVTLVTSMLCHIKWLRGKEKILFNKKTHLLDAILYCRKPGGVTITVTDLVTYNGNDYEIVDVMDFRNLGVLLEIAIRKVK